MSDDKTYIQITREQHERLKQVKSYLKQEKSEQLALSDASWNPSFADALEAVLQDAGRWRMTQDLDRILALPDESNSYWADDNEDDDTDSDTEIDPSNADWDDVDIA